MHVKVRQTCRLCGSKSLTPILNLGPQLLASAFASKENQDFLPLRKVPLELVRCNPELDENACGLVQLRHTFPSDIMYTDYWYASGVNQTMRDALADITTKAKQFVNIEKGDIAVDIGCNDGTLLKSYKNSALDLIGFDPAKNFVGVEGEGFSRINDYFNKHSYVAARGVKKAKIVTSIAMFYDLEDPISFTQDIADILDENGVWILQMADLPNMLRNNMFDNICHEHLTFYHMAPIEYLLKRCGMKLVDVEMNFVNGSSYRFYIRKAVGSEPTPDALKRIAKVRFEEFNLALDTDTPYQKFKDNIERNKNDLFFFINQERAKGKKVFVYGASTKGNVLLQYCDLNEEAIPYAAERNPRKWGTRTLGSNIPIISEEDARALKPDYFLVLPYHFLDEMLVREKEFIDRGGKFIVPVPVVKLVP
ncbi:MAG: class I SAM-dependent methyltransferase [Burkholderiales bacterium]|nr:class I SAM-dependent methyltransferase [Burkholderiales bacterium]